MPAIIIMALRLPEKGTPVPPHPSSPQLFTQTYIQTPMTCLLNPAKTKQNKIWASGMGLRALLGDVQSLQSQKWRVEERGGGGKGAWVPRESCRQQIRAEAATAGASRTPELRQVNARRLEGNQKTKQSWGQDILSLSLSFSRITLSSSMGGRSPCINSDLQEGRKKISEL